MDKSNFYKIFDPMKTLLVDQEIYYHTLEMIGSKNGIQPSLLYVCFVNSSIKLLSDTNCINQVNQLDINILESKFINEEIDVRFFHNYLLQTTNKL